ncbi:MAG TPA: efflux RND transporter periplasmic adaptor subunit [Zoogloea sp.]|uniref:efflux RND transporter periplasmic adaptor subunit n=1 Tax=Zoogloea sp. TaxID=49181 RepID=UPI002C815931|nr:efflux RND transporter periplasmic adaptor subunit [Zoogloea sp.]HMV64007.1 efflux RND transporter periplasmic adaptor subunit [Rhodocyclaceae bacterium]HMW51250.1 efflux RND transporter periplasmic adaptor subunit [Rhodocyclaceae bacterium]HMY48965.1 efflux RND transporter periplasmic adaptor subunit [Rhodocyclaceae bacterium]HMZ77395.1 efflux RND transporter periplasmic adaptor subunit [Rhodocyclaceae bacterium]HNA68806.1 efflux RND transporter periplasmic adaptor subunit [Rhodocyclaceae 
MTARPNALLTSVPVLLAATLLAACGSKDDKAGGMPPGGMPALPVTVLEMQPTKVETSVEAVAQTEGPREVEVRARVGGILVKRLYDEGAAVKAGQPLFQIDREPYEVAVAQAKAQVAEAKARVDQTRREAARLKGLLAQQAISQREYDTATSDDAAAAAAVLAAEAALRQAQLNLEYATVTAPVAGLTGRVAVSEGNLLATGGGTLLTTVVQVNPMWVRFSLAEADLAAATPGGRFNPKAVRGVELVLPDGSTYPVRGHLNFSASQVDPKLGTLQLRGEFANPDNVLLPGQFVRARLLTGERDGVFKVPQNAVMQTDMGAVVMLANADNKVEPRPVKTGNWSGKDWVILGGLKAGDKVIVDNLIKIRPGAPVAPHGPGEGPGAPGGQPGAPAAAPAKG